MNIYLAIFFAIAIPIAILLEDAMDDDGKINFNNVTFKKGE